jgi:excisionase family DNA binding protein
LALSLTHLNRIIKRGDLPFIKIGRRVLFRESSLEQFIERRTVQGGHGDGHADEVGQ